MINVTVERLSLEKISCVRDSKQLDIIWMRGGSKDVKEATMGLQDLE